MTQDNGAVPKARSPDGAGRSLSAAVKVVTDGAFVGLPVMIVLQVGNTTLAAGVYVVVFFLMVILATLGLRVRGGVDPVAMATRMATERPPGHVASVALRAVFTLVGAWAVVFGSFGLVRAFGKQVDFSELSSALLAASLAFSILASIAVSIEPRATPPSGKDDA